MIVRKLIKGALLGGIVVFLWGFFSWMVLPFHQSTMKTFKNENEVRTVISRNAPESGVYFLPGPQANAQKAKAQPFIFATVDTNGNQMGVGHLVRGFIIQALGALIATAILLCSHAHRFWSKVAVVTALGLFSAIVGLLPAWNWLAFPVGYTLIGIADLVIGWFLAGLVLAWANCGCCATSCCSSQMGSCGSSTQNDKKQGGGGCCGR